MKLDRELFHPSHPEHKLKIEHTEIPFRCDGCKEAGIGFKYKCDACDFDLHKACALAPSMIAHPFYSKCEFHFHSKPPGPLLRICDACRKDVHGFVYHCMRCDFDLHPCCANLPQCLDDGERNFHLSLRVPSSCHICGGKGLGWSYRSDCKNYTLHVSCVKELLVESWQAMYLNLDKNIKVRDIQTRIPIKPQGGDAKPPQPQGEQQQAGEGWEVLPDRRRCRAYHHLGCPGRPDGYYCSSCWRIYNKVRIAARWLASPAAGSFMFGGGFITKW